MISCGRDTNQIRRILSIMPIHWGIVSAGKISHDFVCGLSTLSKQNHEVVAVAARNLESAKTFAKTHGIVKAYQGYEALAKDTNVRKYLFAFSFKSSIITT